MKFLAAGFSDLSILENEACGIFRFNFTTAVVRYTVQTPAPRYWHRMAKAPARPMIKCKGAVIDPFEPSVELASDWLHPAPRVPALIATMRKRACAGGLPAWW